MNILESYIKEFLTASAKGKVVQVIPGSACVYMLSDPTPYTMENLRVSLVLSLTEKGLIRGILDVPITHHGEGGLIWVKGFRILCVTAVTHDYSSWFEENRPFLPPALTLAIGGPAGVGKTVLIRRLLASAIGERVMQYVAYTTRPRRPHEIDGMDYHFVDPTDFESYRTDPRFTGFVEARGYWYWIDPSIFFKARWTQPKAIHIFAITQVREFRARRLLAPDLRWIWLDASRDVLKQRLTRRGDDNIAQSLAQNQRLEVQDRTGLISLHINTEVESVNDSLRRLLTYIQDAWEEKS